MHVAAPPSRVDYQAIKFQQDSTLTASLCAEMDEDKKKETVSRAPHQLLARLVTNTQTPLSPETHQRRPRHEGCARDSTISLSAMRDANERSEQQLTTFLHQNINGNERIGIHYLIENTEKEDTVTFLTDLGVWTQVCRCVR